jgi:hypothetical protein
MQLENSPLRHPLPCSHCLVNDGKDPDDDSYAMEFVQYVSHGIKGLHFQAQKHRSVLNFHDSYAVTPGQEYVRCVSTVCTASRAPLL